MAPRRARGADSCSGPGRNQVATPEVQVAVGYGVPGDGPGHGPARRAPRGRGGRGRRAGGCGDGGGPQGGPGEQRASPRGQAGDPPRGDRPEGAGLAPAGFPRRPGEARARRRRDAYRRGLCPGEPLAVAPSSRRLPGHSHGGHCPDRRPRRTLCSRVPRGLCHHLGGPASGRQCLCQLPRPRVRDLRPGHRAAHQQRLRRARLAARSCAHRVLHQDGTCPPGRGRAVPGDPPGGGSRHPPGPAGRLCGLVRLLLDRPQAQGRRRLRRDARVGRGDLRGLCGHRRLRRHPGRQKEALLRHLPRTDRRRADDDPACLGRPGCWASPSLWRAPGWAVPSTRPARL